jgi:hypothetical protein
MLPPSAAWRLGSGFWKKVKRNKVVKPGAGRHEKERKKLARNLNGQIMASTKRSTKRLLTFHPQIQIKHKWCQKKEESVQSQCTYNLLHVIRPQREYHQFPTSSST